MYYVSRNKPDGQRGEVVPRILIIRLNDKGICLSFFQNLV